MTKDLLAKTHQQQCLSSCLLLGSLSFTLRVCTILHHPYVPRGSYSNQMHTVCTRLVLHVPMMSVMECVDMDVRVGSLCVATVVIMLAVTIMILVAGRISRKHAVGYHTTLPVSKFTPVNFTETPPL